MRKLSIVAGIAAMTVSTAVTAHDTATGYPSRGACEAASAGMSNDENAWLVATFPQILRHDGRGGELPDQGIHLRPQLLRRKLYYITDHIEDVLGSDWFAQRNH